MDELWRDLFGENFGRGGAEPKVVCKSRDRIRETRLVRCRAVSVMEEGGSEYFEGGKEGPIRTPKTQFHTSLATRTTFPRRFR